MAPPEPYPLLLEPIFFEKVWGGRRLAALGRRLPAAKNIGESWEVADMPATAASGAGGAEVRSRIAAGPLAGRTLHDAWRLWGGAGDFPLLVKFLDARENLSVQVHPSPEYARANPGARLKTECWYVLDAQPGSVIYKGLRPGVSHADFCSAARGTTLVDCLERVPAVKGDCHLLPSGTVHALGAGVLVAEIQTPSDTTFRLHDWGRTGRELHLAPALACTSIPPPPPTTRSDTPLASTPYFQVEETCGDQHWQGAWRAALILEGSATITGGGHTQHAPLGASLVIPSGASTTLHGSARALVATLP